MKKILTIDGNNLVHRVYWVANNMAKKSDNFHVYMFLNAVKSYTDMYKADTVICVWDEKPDYRKNKRRDLLEEYKGNRDYDSSVHDKNELIKELLQLMGIPSIYPRDYEADDVIGFIDGYFYDDEHIIVTVDKDLCQLISEDTVVYDPIRKYEINLENFTEKLKYDPEDFIKVKALQGDKSDNIPGLKGFGKVKIGKFLDGVIRLTEEENKIYTRNLKLVTLSKDLEEEDYVIKQLKNCSFKSDFTEFISLCKKCWFTNILKYDQKWFTTFFEKNRLIDLLS
tara:strand:+ start:505 stop:1350 length:846 start_codon:yes stop_codon:yes gene_type:complete